MYSLHIKYLSRFWNLYGSIADPNVWERIQIRILAFLNDPTSTIMVCEKALSTLEISVA
jgi:hypothetical protein